MVSSKGESRREEEVRHVNIHLFIFREFTGDYEIRNDVLVVPYETLEAALNKKEHLVKRYGSTSMRPALAGSAIAKDMIGNTRLEIKIEEIEKLPEWGS